MFLNANTNLYSQFRGYDWGTDRQMIIEKEGTPGAEDGDYIAYQGEVGGRDCYIIFTFIDNKLKAGALQFTKKNTTELVYINDFKSLDDVLKERYGSPISSRSRFVIDRIMEDNEFISEGMKLATGAIGFQTEWELENLNIRHILQGNEFDISHNLVYFSLDYEELKKQKQVSDF